MSLSKNHGKKIRYRLRKIEEEEAEEEIEEYNCAIDQTDPDGSEGNEPSVPV